MKIIESLIAILFAYLRIAGHKSIPFQAFAHFYVGGPFFAWYVLKARGLADRGWYLCLGGLLTSVECFRTGYDRLPTTIGKVIIGVGCSIVVAVVIGVLTTRKRDLAPPIITHFS